MKKLMPCFAIVICMLIISTCGNPALNKQYNNATVQDDFKAIANSLNAEDLQLLSMYIVKAKFTGQNLVDKTYQNLLDDAKRTAK